MKTVLIAEKSTQVKLYAKALGEATYENGVTVVYNTPTLGDVYIAHASGHLIQLNPMGTYDKRLAEKDWSKTLPYLPFHPQTYTYSLDKKVAKLFHTIERLIKDCDQIIIGTDPDREGELIAHRILNYAKSVQSVDGQNVQLSNKTIPLKRVGLVSMTPSGAKQAIDNISSDEAMYHKYFEASARSKADWEVGMNLSKIMAISMRQKGYGWDYYVGRVQMAILTAVVENHQAIESFTSENYQKVVLVDQATGTEFKEMLPERDDGKPKGHYNPNEAQSIIDTLLDSPSHIESVKSELKTGSRPKLYTLASLSKEMAKKYHYSETTVLDVLESLYIKGFTTYPRSEVAKITPEEYQRIKTNKSTLMSMYSIDEKLDEDFQKKYLLSEKELAKASHVALVPTDKIPKSSDLPNEETRRIYKAVVMRALTMFAPDYTYQATQVIAKIKDKQFAAVGTVVKTLGWKQLLKEKGAETVLPIYQEGQSIDHQLKIIDDVTKPPKQITLSTLWDGKEMKEISTPASRGQAVDKVIKERQYVVKDKKGLLSPSLKGLALYRALSHTMLTDLKNTRAWEVILTEIGKGNPKATESLFIQSITQKIDEIAEKIKSGDFSIDLDPKQVNPYKPSKKSAKYKTKKYAK